MKHALVTGGAGFIGQHLVNLLVERGWRVTVLDDYSTGDAQRLYQSVRTVYHDVSRPFPDTGHFDVLFHLAAVSRIGACEADPARATEVNFYGTLNAVLAAQRCGAKVVFASTCAAAEPRLSKYATTKRNTELLFPTAGVPYSILRLFNVYGDHEPHAGPTSTVVARFLHALRTGKPCVVHGDGTQRRDFVHVSDVVNAMILCAERDTPREPMDCGTGVSYSVSEVAAMTGGDVVYAPLPPGQMRDTRADPTVLRGLGWSPRYDLPAWVQEQVTLSKTFAGSGV